MPTLDTLIFSRPPLGDRSTTRPSGIFTPYVYTAGNGLLFRDVTKPVSCLPLRNLGLGVSSSMRSSSPAPLSSELMPSSSFRRPSYSARSDRCSSKLPGTLQFGSIARICWCDSDHRNGPSLRILPVSASEIMQSSDRRRPNDQNSEPATSVWWTRYGRRQAKLIFF